MTAPPPRFVLALLLVGATRLQGGSFYPERLEDPSAVYAAPPRFDVRGDGVHDDTRGLQQAIDAVADSTRQGIVFVPAGRYRVTGTLYVWPGIRLIGYGPQRPVFVLPPNSPGYGRGPAYLVVFTGGRGPGRWRGASLPTEPFPGSVPPRAGIIDANPGTFYSALSNIDFEIGDGNPGAVAIRFHVAQHCFLSHVTFREGSAWAALEDIGNEAEDLHFIGGQFGIVTGRPSPGWQFTLLDSVFEGQRTAAIREHEAGLTLVHDTFRDVPAAIDIEAGHIEELWVEDSHFERVSGPAITISEELSRLTEITIKNLICQDVPVYARLRDSGTDYRAPGPVYRVRHFVHGLGFDEPSANSAAPDHGGRIVTRAETGTLPSPPADGGPAIPPPPASTGWANARLLGAKGDGATDDTRALQRAIDTHAVVYLPSGRYRLTDTLRLRPGAVLIGLHPSTTQLDLADQTPGFFGAGNPKPLLLALPGGSTRVTGIGLYTGGINNLAAAAIWKAGPRSLMDDVRFLGGHGTNAPDGTRINPYDASHGGDPNPLYRWDAQYPSLWITDGGGGTFADIWTPDTFAQAGLCITDTATEGRVYELSSEHHVRNEVIVDRAANWELVALQTEEERGESGACLPLDIRRSRAITVAQMHAYRVVSSFAPFREAVHVAASRAIQFFNLHVDSDSKAVFEDSVRDGDRGEDYRDLELAELTVGGGSPAPPRHPIAERLATGFYNLSSPAFDSGGRLYFADPVKERIYRYDPTARRVEMVCDHPIEAANLLFDAAGDLLIVSAEGAGTVYATRPEWAGVRMQRLAAEPAATRPDASAVLSVDYWRSGRSPHPWQFVSPDRSVFLPAGDDFVSGALYYGVKMADVLRAFALRPVKAGEPFYFTDERDEETYVGTADAMGALRNVRRFADQGGESVAAAPNGRVFIAAGQIYVYTAAGKRIGEIDVPERPTALAFAPHGQTLYILARTSLYAVQAAGAIQ